MSNERPVLVILGIGSDDKPHAAHFEASQDAAVRKAATLMGFQIGRAEADAAATLARSLPAGRFFETGKAFVPFVKSEIYDELLKSLIVEPTAKGSVGRKAKDKATPTADPWAGIKVGSVVLALETPSVGGWFESIVLSIGKDGMLSLRWRNWPKMKPFKAKRHDVAIMASSLRA